MIPHLIVYSTVVSVFYLSLALSTSSYEPLCTHRNTFFVWNWLKAQIGDFWEGRFWQEPVQAEYSQHLFCIIPWVS